MKEDWIETLFGELLDIQGGSQPPKKNFIYEPKEGYVRLLQIQDFGKKPHPTFIPIEMARKTCVKEDIFIARYGASLGRILRGMEGAYNVALAKVIRKIDVFEDDFLFNLLKTQIFQQPIHMISRSAQNGFAKSDLNSITIPIPPLVEQKVIVKKIEALFSSLDSGIADLKRAQDQLKIYRQAVLKKAFEGEYPQKKIIEIADVKTGATPKRGNSEYWENGSIPWVTSTVVNEEYVNEPSELINETAIKETNCKVIPKGSLLMAMYGEGKTRGKCSELNIDAATNQALAAITLLEENKDSKKFLKLFLLKNYEEIRLLSSGGVQPNLNLTIVKNTIVPFPKPEEQHQIVQEIESRLSVCDAVEQNIKDSLDKAQALRQSILKKAFEGKLLSEEEIAACKANPEYEPASVLLEKIKAEKIKK